MIVGTGEKHVCSLAGCSSQMRRAFDRKIRSFSYVTSLCNPTSMLPCMYTSDFGDTDAANARIVSENILHSADKLQLPSGAIHLGISTSPGSRGCRCINCISRLNRQDYFDEKYIDRPVTFGLSNMVDHGNDMAFEFRMHADVHVGHYCTSSAAYGCAYSRGA